MSAEQASSKLRKTVQTRLLFIDIILAVDLRVWSIDQKYIIIRSSPRGIFGHLAKKLLVLKLRFFLQVLHLLKE